MTYLIAAVAAVGDATKGSNLPPDVAADVISRLPLKSLVRFKCLSKAWFHLITFSKFPLDLLTRRYLHHCQGKKHHCCAFQVQCNLILSTNKRKLKEDGKLYSIGGGHSEDKFRVAKEISCNFLGWKLNYFEIKSHSCDGMMCVSCNYTRESDGGTEQSLVLWNPSIREYRELPLAIDFGLCQGVCGLGFNPNMDDYKVVSVINKREIHVFSVKRKTWRYVGNCHFDISSQGVAANGCLYWLVEESAATRDTNKVLVSLDLSDDRLREVPIPACFGVPNKNLKELRITLLPNFDGFDYKKGGGGGSGPLFIYRRHDLSFWAVKRERQVNGGVSVIEEGEVRYTWTQILSIPDRIIFVSSFHPKCITVSGKLIISMNNKLREYNPKTQTHRMIYIQGLEDAGGGGWNGEVIVYKESLISPSGIRGMDDID